MEPVLKIWYEGLKAGKMRGLKCKRCGAVSFPPYPVCNECSCMESEWVEISGKCTLKNLGYAPNGIPPYHDNPTVIGYVELEEGTKVAAPIEGVKKKNIPDLLESFPLEAELGIQDLDETISYTCVKLRKN